VVSSTLGKNQKTTEKKKKSKKIEIDFTNEEAEPV